jgi:alpha-tubulin suppressor-like RCC1 family protein
MEMRSFAFFQFNFENSYPTGGPMLHLLKIFFHTLPLFCIVWLGSMSACAAELSGVAAIAAGLGRTCALITAGGVKCWGNNSEGQLGDNSTTNSLTPVNVTGLASGVAAIAAEDSHTCALTTAGGVKCWGNNSEGQLGDNSTTNRLTPVGVMGLASGVVAIAAGYYHTCALTTAGGIKCWGNNVEGELGDNSTTNRLTPVDVTGLASGVAAIAAGGFNTCALTTAGGVKCWGDNSEGQLGDNSIINRLMPVNVTGLTSSVTAIAAGLGQTCALTTAGGIKCWGYNGEGELGDNSTTNRLTPVGVTGLASGVTAIAAGLLQTCALTTAGGVKCWGDNSDGQLGDNSTTNRLTPVGVTGLASGVAAIAAGDSHTCALITAGGVKCWGYNGEGQLGDNSTTNRLTPVAVVNSVVNPGGGAVVEFYNTNLDNYFITADAGEAAAIDGGSAGPGWIRTGGSFKSGGSTSVCRFYGSQVPGPNSHFYTVDPGECASLKQLQAATPATVKRWNFESLDFISTPSAGGQCPAGTEPVYRAYNNGFARGVDSNHRISTDQAAIAQVVARGWVNEGVVMCAPL